MDLTGDPIDFSANINPLGFPPWLRKEINRNIETLTHYPDPEQKELRTKAAEYFNINHNNIIFGNGASEFISILPNILQIDNIIIPAPSYSEYENSYTKIIPSYLIMDAKTNFTLNFNELSKIINTTPGRKLIYIGQPNNPTGKSVPNEMIIDLAERHKNSFFCIDESLQILFKVIKL